jgi:hypothetical protein
VFIYNHINDQSDRLDMSQFRRCGFLSIHQGVVKDCTVPLTPEALLQITGTTAYTPADMEEFTKETLGKKVLKSELPSLQAVKEESKVKRLARKEKKAAEKEVSPSSVVSQVAAAKAEFLGTFSIDEGISATEEEHAADWDQSTDWDQLERVALSSPGIVQSPQLPTPPMTNTSDSPRSSISSSPPAFTTSFAPSNTSRELVFSSSCGASREASPCGYSSLRQDAVTTGAKKTPILIEDSGSTSSVSSPDASYDPVAMSLLRRMVQNTEGCCDDIKIECFFNSSKTFLLALIEIVSFVTSNGDKEDLGAFAASSLSCVDDVNFKLYRAHGVGADGCMLASMNTQGDGYCLFRASEQAETRSLDPSVTVAALKESDWKKSSDQLADHISTYIDVVHFANPHTHMLTQTKLEECLFNAQNFVGEVNPRACWGADSWLRFQSFDFALLEFSDGGDVVVEGANCRWGQLTRIPFHYFGEFYFGVPTPTLAQLQVVLRKSNHIGFSSGHFFILENHPFPSREKAALGGAVRSWMTSLIPAVRALSPTDVSNIRAFGERLRTEPAKPRKTIQTSIGDVGIDGATNRPVVSYNDKHQPVCTDTLFEIQESGGYNKQDVIELLAAVSSRAYFVFVLLTVVFFHSLSF